MERSVLELSGIPWNYLELFLELLINLHKIPLEFLEFLREFLGLPHDEKFQSYPPRSVEIQNHRARDWILKTRGN
jgi:hypothetical protein